jgi:hypothetical protein
LLRHPDLFTSSEDSVYYLTVSSASTQITRDSVSDFFLGWIRVLVKQCLRCHYHPRRAETTLDSAFLDEGFLKRMKLFPIPRESFDRHYILAVQFSGQYQAGMRCLPVQENRASTALTTVATSLRASKKQIPSQNIQQSLR